MIERRIAYDTADGRMQWALNSRLEFCKRLSAYCADRVWPSGGLGNATRKYFNNN